MIDKKIIQLVNKIRSFARPRYIPVIHDEGADVLINAIKTYNPKRILEIGTSLGTSGILMLASCQASLTTIDINEEAVNIAKSNFWEAGFLNRVEFIIADCMDVIPFMTRSYDFIFLDGPKGQYLNMLPYLTEMLKTNGVLFADNIYFHDMVKAEGKIEHKHRTLVVGLKNFIDELNTSQFFKTEFIDKGDGISISVKVKD